MFAVFLWIDSLKDEMKIRIDAKAFDGDFNPLNGHVSRDVTPARRFERSLFWKLYDALPGEYQKHVCGVGGDSEHRILYAAQRYVYKLLGKDEDLVQ